MLGEALVVDVVFQLLKSAIDEDVIDEGPYQCAVGFSPVEVGRFGRSIDHAVTGGIGFLSLLDIVPVLNGQVALEPEYFEADPRAAEVVLCMGEHVVTVREGSHDIDAGRAL